MFEFSRLSISKTIICGLLVTSLLASPSVAQDRRAVVRQVIAESQAAYPGNCPCPENRDARGSRCGKRSAWSRAGGYSPICYANEVTDAIVARWVRQHG